MKVIQMKLNDIKPYDKNPRKNDGAVDMVANSIKEFGFKVPIIIDKNNIIVAGHTRHKAGKKLGWKEVPVIVADDLTDEQIKAFRLADNKVSEFSEWDYNELTLELVDINLDMADFGFDLASYNVGEFGTDFELASGDKGILEQITFTLDNEQAELIKELLETVKNDEGFNEYHKERSVELNSNKNGNALVYLLQKE